MRDPNDDMVIACGVAGRAERIVTRDKDLLPVESYQGIAILEPEEFRALLRSDVPESSCPRSASSGFRMFEVCSEMNQVGGVHLACQKRSTCQIDLFAGHQCQH
jgi:hypothetical protein